VAPDQLVGTILGERYELIERIGRGGTAVVYRGLDHRLGRTVAVKIIHDTLVGDADYTRRFDREARAAAALSHPNIVAIFDRGTAGERPYIVMECVRGQSLRQVIAQQAPLTPTMALSYLDAIARALAAAHDAGLMHRDIKPENVLITTGGQVKVTDFGLAKASQQNTASQSILMGTLSYLAPEIMTTGQASFASDIYAAGIVLYELLTGHKPHTGDEAANVLYKHVNIDVPPPSQALSGSARQRIPDYLDALVATCTSRNPALRPPNGQALEQVIAPVRRRLRQGLTSDPALADRLLQGPDHQPQTTVLLPESPATGDVIRPVEATAPVTSVTPEDHAADWDDWEADADLPSPAAAINRSPARPLVQLSRDPKYTRRRVGLAALLLVIVLGLVGAGVGFWWFKTGRWTVQPNVAGTAASQAQATLTEAGLTVNMVEQYSETVAAGLVIDSQPGDGVRLVKHSLVTLTVSKGPERYSLPDLRGLTQDQAVTTLANCLAPESERAAKCPRLGAVTPVWDEVIAAGLIVSQSQDPGAALAPATAVDITVSQGRQPIDIPDLTGQPADQAATTLTGLNFTVTTTEEHSATVPAGAVISQTPKTGTGHIGDSITLVKSLGPVMVTVPNIVGQNEKKAKETLSQAGLVAVVEGDAFFNLVRDQSPASGTVVAQGSSVSFRMV
jgi:serine/threonine-protein kinase